jgi:hypothetical protein
VTRCGGMTTLAGGEAAPRREKGGETSQKKESYIGMTIRVRVAGTRPVPDPMGMGMGAVFYPRVSPVPDLKQNGYGKGFLPTRGRSVGYPDFSR